MNAILGNWKTTLFGFGAAVLMYFTQIEGGLPATKEEWGKALIAACIAAWGAVSKDASTGSKA